MKQKGWRVIEVIGNILSGVMKGLLGLLLVAGFVVIVLALINAASHPQGSLAYSGSDPGMGCFIGIVAIMVGGPFVIMAWLGIEEVMKKEPKKGPKGDDEKPEPPKGS